MTGLGLSSSPPPNTLLKIFGRSLLEKVESSPVELGSYTMGDARTDEIEMINAVRTMGRIMVSKGREILRAS